MKNNCCNCDSLGGYVTLWCLNKEAANENGTAMPEIVIKRGIDCNYWKPIRKSLKENEMIDDYLNLPTVKFLIEYWYVYLSLLIFPILYLFLKK